MHLLSAFRGLMSSKLVLSPVSGFPGVDPTSTGRPEGTRSDESFSLISPYSSVSKPQEDSPLIMGEGIRVPGRERNSEPCIAFPWEVDMHDIKERLSVLWIFALLNYLYADVIALWAILGSPPADTPHLGQLALAGSAVLMEIPIAVILASRLLPPPANRLADIIAGSIVTLVNGFLTFIPPLVGWGRPPALPEYLFFATIETVCTVAIVWQAWTWSGADESRRREA